MTRTSTWLALLAFSAGPAFAQAPAAPVNDDDGNPIHLVDRVDSAQLAATHDDDGNPIVLLSALLQPADGAADTTVAATSTAAR